MPSYRIHRLRESVRQQFRFAPHVTGAAIIKERDYEPDNAMEASTPYAAFFALRDAGAALLVGDVLEAESGELRIFKYVGFEEARWFVPGPVPEPVPEPVLKPVPEPKTEEVLVQNARV